jgi:hypothetical protein
MNSTFIKVKTIHGDIVRINVTKIVNYHYDGQNTHVETTSSTGLFSLEITADELDKALHECSFTVKEVNHYEPLPPMPPYEEYVRTKDRGESHATDIHSPAECVYDGCTKPECCESGCHTEETPIFPESPVEQPVSTDTPV